ncbi:2-amino-4-oxopentanoate thiolase subunit OrtB [Haloplasma contractile]|uniref:Cystathionine beta-synthase protein n=1 Tax=Haloplasma contractile SSD-17B TaxID=1033810 RepID=U2DSZ0_9MOLU|nr:2-amino-4-oxopentanoate thiolase subunit OrtB [Haloplasma contractile]ERJ11612.1 cystathionine beta-synthase protein [Haloplasma contractile SSD-17B]
MAKDLSYEGLMARRNEIMKKSVGIDYSKYENEGIGFNYEKMMEDAGYSFEKIKEVQSENGVGNTPLKELRNITKFVRKLAPVGKGARIFIKDESLNDSGSYKARRASMSCYHAKELGYKGVIAATSGNYGAAVASQAAKYGLKCIIVQECYDSEGKGQPEIIEKARKCEALGAEVVQLTVGPELFYTFLKLLEETGYFNASLYTPFGIAGVETLGYELVEQCKKQIGKEPDMVVVTNAGGGNLTGTARGIKRITDKDIEIVASSVNLKGLHMASDKQFNRKSFTTGHTGFGIPFSTYPDRSDVPRSAGRPLRYMDRYVTVNQGEVFFMTEALTKLEGIERGPAGNTSLAAAVTLAQELDENQIIVVQETEYTGAGKHHQAQLSFAKKNGIDVRFGNPEEEIPGQSIILPEHPRLIKAKDLSLAKVKQSCIKNHIKNNQVTEVTEQDIKFLMEETRESKEFVENTLDVLSVKYKK